MSEVMTLMASASVRPIPFLARLKSTISGTRDSATETQSQGPIKTTSKTKMAMEVDMTIDLARAIQQCLMVQSHEERFAIAIVKLLRDFPDLTTTKAAYYLNITPEQLVPLHQKGQKLIALASETLASVGHVPVEPGELGKQFNKVFRQNPTMTIKELAKKLGKSEAFVYGELNLMEEKISHLEYRGKMYESDEALEAAMEAARPEVRAEIIAFIKDTIDTLDDRQLAELMHRYNLIIKTPASEALFQDIDPELYD